MTKQYLKEMDNHIEAILKIASHLLEDAGNEFKKRVVQHTPLGNPLLWKRKKAPYNYVPGNLKASWKMHKIYSQGKLKEIIIYNDAPYALRVERGWSTQIPPKGMMRQTVSEMPGVIAKLARKYRRR